MENPLISPNDAKIMIDKHLLQKNLQIIHYDNRTFDIDSLCGERISGTCNIEYLQTLYNDPEYVTDNIILLCINLENDEVVGLFVGTIELEDNLLESTYTCSKIKGVGELLRYYGFLHIYNMYPTIKILTGSASGGIRALHNEMSTEEEEIAKDRLKQYHIKRGASLKESIFVYTWDTILRNVVQLTDTTLQQGGRLGRNLFKLYLKRKLRKTLFHNLGYWL